MTQDTEAITRTFRNYVASFQTLQPAAVVAYCQTPCMFISFEGVFLMANAKEMATADGEAGNFQEMPSRGESPKRFPADFSSFERSTF